MKHPVPPYPRAHSAAVIVALFVGRAGDLHVVLSRQVMLIHIVSLTSDAIITGEP